MEAHSPRLPVEHVTEYAVGVDSWYGFRLLCYYIDRDAQERQLQSCGFELLECLDGDGRPVSQGERPPRPAALHYAAQARK